MDRKRIELLAPAGNKEAFIGAINAGANAVYISGKNFGARKFADNFTQEEIVEMIRYAHLRNVKVYVTVNTLIFEEEISELLQYSDFLVSNQVDALIVQDLGVIHLFCKRYPDTEIHASTQMNTYNVHQLQYLKNLGVKRVVLARETSIETIRKMRQEVEIDLEVFVHGALCVSYSGNCLFSSMQGGRSGNRGECAQPCRLKYSLFREDELIEPESYLLSAKDLMTIQNLDQIIEAGVFSLKVEGRMRRPQYVIATVRAYREALDYLLESKPFDVEQRIRELLSVFNRQYTKGYLLQEEPYLINNPDRPNHLGIEIGEVLSYHYGKTTIRLTDTLRVGDGIRILDKQDQGGQVGRILLNGNTVREAYTNDIVIIDMPKQVSSGSKVMKTQDTKLESSLNEYLSENFGIIPITIKLYSFVGSKLTVEAQIPMTENIRIESEYQVVPSQKASQNEEMLAKQFSKFGNTYFSIKEIKIETDGIGFVPNGVLNELRRELVNRIESMVLSRKEPRIQLHNFPVLSLDTRLVEPQFVVRVETDEQLQTAIKLGIKEIYYSTKVKDTSVIDSSVQAYLMQDRIWEDLPSSNINALVIRDFGLLQLARARSVVADATMNVTNSLSVNTLIRNGVKRVCLSIESSEQNTQNLIQEYRRRYGYTPNLEMIVYGKADLMITKYCPVTKSEGIYKQNCSLCQRNQYSLHNDKGDFYSLIRDGYCNLRILHSRPISLIAQLQSIIHMGVTTLRLDFTDETKEEVEQIILAFQSSINNQSYIMPKKDYTYGRYFR